MKKNLFLLAVLFLISTIMWAQTATINLNAEKQTIKGFGGINHPTWYSDLNAAERELAFGNGPGQLGLTVLRTYVSDNSNEWGLGLQTAQRAAELGVTVFASPWNPPANMTRTVNGVKRINPAFYAGYADHLNSYVTYMKNNGVNLYAISTQNEPDYAHDWTEWSPQESVDFIKGYGNRIDCRLMTPESFQYRKDVYKPILDDPAALANVDIFGTHLYGTRYADFPYPLFEQKGAGKELWMTEVYTDSKYDANIWNNGFINDDRHALKVAEHIHYAMVDGQFQTYVFWPLRRYYALIHDGNSDNQGNAPASAGTATKRGYCMAQFSKWIRPGFVRVEATKSPTNNVFVSAYKKDGEIVIVIVNKNTSSKTITLNIPGLQATVFEPYTTSGSKNIAKGNNINGSSSFQVTLDAASITTFVGAGTKLPEVTITAPSVDTNVVIPAEVYIEAEVSDPSAIQTLQFFVNGEQVGTTEWVEPYFKAFSITETGTYELTAVITGSDGSTKTSAIRTITANVPQAPFNGPNTVPGIIQAEDYDVGGKGIAYNDTDDTNENDVDYRAGDGVDIETTQDVGGGYNVGYILTGEWLAYTVDVSSAGTYDLDLRMATEGDGKLFHIEIDGQNISGPVTVPNTGGWQIWETVTVEGLSLTEGTHEVKLVFNSDYMNLNYMEFRSQVVTSFNSIKNTAVSRFSRIRLKKMVLGLKPKT